MISRTVEITLVSARAASHDQQADGHGQAEPPRSPRLMADRLRGMFAAFFMASRPEQEPVYRPRPASKRHGERR